MSKAIEFSNEPHGKSTPGNVLFYLALLADRKPNHCMKILNTGKTVKCSFLYTNLAKSNILDLQKVFDIHLVTWALFAKLTPGRFSNILCS